MKHPPICRVVLPGACLAAMLIAAASFAAEKGGAEKAPAGFDPIKQFDHLGIFTAEKKPNERLVKASMVWVTDIEAHPYRVEWLRTDKPRKGPVRPNPHVAFRVDSIAEAAKGFKVKPKPFDAGIAKVGFFQHGRRCDRRVHGVLSHQGQVDGGIERRPRRSKRPGHRLTFDHVGFIADEKKPGERFVPATKVWVTDIAVASVPRRMAAV